MDASGNNSPEFAVTTQGTGAGELVWLASGQQIGVSGLSVSISGISISAGPTTTTQASTGITGNFVWLAGSQTISVQISGIAPTTTAAGASGVTGLPVWVGNPGSGSGASATATSQSAMSTGLGVWLAPTQTVTAAISGVVPTTTASGLSGITGLPVWVANPGSGSGATASATSQSAMSTALGVWLAPTQTLALVSTVATVLGTVLVSEAGPVSISGIAATTTASGLSGITGLPVWVANPGSGSGATASATSQSAMSTALGVWLAPTQTISLVSTIVTILGTQVVSVVPGLSVSAVVPSITAVSTVVTVLGTVAVSQVAAISISGIAATTTASGLSGVTGLPVWVANPGSGSGATASATSQSAMSTALGVWLAPTQTMTVTALISGITPTTTASGLSGITGLPVWVANPGSGSGATASATSQSAMSTALGVWLAPTQTLALVSTLLTVLGTVLVSEVGPVSISGIAATTTASGLSGITGLPVWVANPGSGSGATASATSQSAMSTALGVWLAPTQTISLVSTIVTILGTQIVSVVPGLSVSAVVPSITGVSTVVTLLGTVAVSQVAAVSLSGAGATVTQSSLTTGIPVIFVQTQTVGAVNTIVTILGTQVVSVVPGLSVSAVVPSITAVSTIVTILGTQIVSVVPGLPVQISGIVPTTTAAGLSGVTGLPVWQVGGGGGTTLISVVSTIITILGFSAVTTSSQAATASGMAVWVGNPGGASGATATSQSAMSTALGVWLAPTQTITVAISAIAATTTASGLSGISGLPVWVGNTVSVTVSVSVSLSGSLQISGIVPTTTASGLSGVTGLPVWMVGGVGGGTTLISVVSTIVTILGFSVVTTSSQAATASGLAVWVGNPGGASGATATSQSAMSTALGVWLAPTQTLSLVSTIVTILGTHVVTVVPGASVTVVTLLGTVAVSQVAAVSLSGAGATATQSSLTTGIPVIFVQTQTLGVLNSVLTIVTQLGTQVVTVVPGVSVSAVVSGTVSLVTVSSVGTVVTLLGTVLVSQVPGASVILSGVLPTTTASGLSGVTGLPIWVGNTVSVTVSVSVSLSGSLQISGILPTTTASGLSGVTGLPVWIAGGSGGARASATSQSAMSTALGVWLAQTQTIALVSTIVTILGTQVVTVVPGLSVSAVVSGLVSITGTSIFVVASGTVTMAQSAQTPVNIAGTLVLAAAASSSAGPIPFTINVGTTAATVGSAWTVPATNFRLYAVNIFVTGAGATTPTAGYFQVAYSSAGTTGTATSPTILSTKPQLVKIPIGFGPAALSVGIVGGQLDIGGGLTQTIMLWFNYPGTTNTSATIMFNLLGYLF